MINNWGEKQDNNIPVYTNQSSELNYFYTNTCLRYEVNEGLIIPIIRDNTKNDYNFITSEVYNLEGISGQGNSKPYSDFQSHYFIELDGKIYDPSYGLEFNSMEEWEKKAVWGFFVCEKNVINEVDEGIDINKDGKLSKITICVIYFRKNVTIQS